MGQAKKTLTPFGRFARRLRIDREERLKDMAASLGVTPGFLSAVETGRRNAPQGWESKLIDAYQLEPEDAAELTSALFASRTYDVVNVAHLPHGDRHLVVGLAAILPTLDRKQRALLTEWIEQAQQND